MAVALGLMGAGAFFLDAVLGSAVVGWQVFLIGLLVLIVLLLVTIPAGQRVGSWFRGPEHPSTVR